MDFLVDYLKKPQWGSQHRWRRAIWNTMSRVGLTGVHALPLNRRWGEIHRRRMPLAGLGPSLSGFKLGQIFHLHYFPGGWGGDLVQIVRWGNDLKPGVGVVTR